MKKLLSLVLGTMLVIGVFSFATAQNKKESQANKGSMQSDNDNDEDDMMMGKDKMREGHIHSVMMASMMSRSVTATQDGGVIVLAGNKLQKYDKNLNLVKETKVTMDMEGMQKMMSQMGNCGMQNSSATPQGNQQQ